MTEPTCRGFGLLGQTRKRGYQRRRNVMVVSGMNA